MAPVAAPRRHFAVDEVVDQLGIKQVDRGLVLSDHELTSPVRSRSSSAAMLSVAGRTRCVETADESGTHRQSRRRFSRHPSCIATHHPRSPCYSVPVSACNLR
jgi:hypothetical protein